MVAAATIHRYGMRAASQQEGALHGARGETRLQQRQSTWPNTSSLKRRLGFSSEWCFQRGGLLLPGGAQVRARSQMAASLGRMSTKGLRPIPMNTRSCKRSSGRVKFQTRQFTSALWSRKARPRVIHSHLDCGRPGSTGSSPGRRSRLSSPPCWRL